MTRLLLRDLTPGSEYWVQLRAVDDDSFSEWSRLFPLTVSSDATPPDTPEWSASGWVVDGDGFVANWEPVDPLLEQNVDFSSYEIELSDGVGIAVRNTGGNTSYTLSFNENRSLFGSPSSTITARVRSVDRAGNRSPWSSQQSATNPAPAAPTGISTNALYDAIDVVWTHGVLPDDFKEFVVQVSTTSASSGFITVYEGPSAQYQHATTMFNTDHWFSVRIRDKFGTLSTSVTSGSVRPKSTFQVDDEPPAVPTNLAATITNNASGVGSRAELTWSQTVPSNNDLAGFRVRWRKSGDIDWSQTDFSHEDRAGVVELQAAHQNYDFQIRSYDWMGNFSAWSATEAATSPGNTAPAQVTGLDSVAGRDSINYTWDASTAEDLKEYEVTFSTSSTFASGNVTFKNGTSASLTVGGLTPDTTYYARVRAIDTSGLTGTFSDTHAKTTGAQLTPGDIGAPTNEELSDVELKNSITYSSDNKTKTYHYPLVWGQTGSGVAGSIVIRTPITLGNYMTRISLKGYNYRPNNTEIDTTVGFYAYSAGTFPQDFQTNLGNAPVTVRLATDANDKIVLIVDHRDGTWYYPKLSVVEATLGHTIPPDSFKDGWSASIETDLTPFSIVKTAAQKDINDTHELTQGWRYTGTTTIDGGNIETDTIDVIKLKANTTFTQDLNVENVFTVGTSGANGIIQSYGYNSNSGWRLDKTGLVINEGSVKASTLIGDTLGSSTGIIDIGVGAAIRLNGGYIKSNTNSGTTMATAEASGAGFYLGDDGLFIGSDGKVKAGALESDTLTSTTITLGSSGVIQGGTWSLSGTGLSIPDGGIEASKLTLQVGNNIMPTRQASWEAEPTSYSQGNGFFVDGGSITEVNDTGGKFGNQKLGSVWGSQASPVNIYLGNSATDYNIPVEDTRAYIFSIYAYSSTTHPCRLKVKWSNGSTTNLDTQNLTGIDSPSGAIRLSGAATPPSGVTGAVMIWEDTTTSASGSVSLDGAQVEEQVSYGTIPSAWAPPGNTVIHGSQIRTGAIRSTANAVDSNGNAISGLPAWSLDPEGDAVFGDVMVRGSLVVGISGESETSVAKSYNYDGVNNGWMITSDGFADFRELAADIINSKHIGSDAVTADRLTVGSRNSESILVNSSFEDYEVNLDGSFDSDGFGGWSVMYPVPDTVTPTVSQEINNPISGSRSMRLTFPDGDHGTSVVNEISHPVVENQTWYFAAKLRHSVTNDRTTDSTNASYIYRLLARYSRSFADPADPATSEVVDASGELLYYNNAADSVRVYPVAIAQSVVAGSINVNGEEGDFFGVSEVPIGFSRMKMECEIAPSGDLAAPTNSYYVDLDDFRASLNIDSIEVMGTGGNIVANIDSAGNAEFESIYVRSGLDVMSENLVIDGTPASEALATGVVDIGTDLTIAGRDIDDVIRDNYRLKFQSGHPDTQTVSLSGGSKVFLEGAFYAKADHVYKIFYKVHARSPNSTTVCDLKWRYETSTWPSNSSPYSVFSTTRNVVEHNTDSFTNTFTWIPPADGRYRWGMQANHISGGEIIITFGGDLRPVVIVEDCGLAEGVGTGLKIRNPDGASDDTSDNVYVPPDDTKTKRTRTWAATWSSGYNGNGGQISSGSNHKQGYYSSTNGNTKAAVGFDDADIRSALSGVALGDITKVELYLYFNHWYNNSGGTAIIGRHGSNAPASWGSLSSVVTDVVRSSNWPKPGGRWVNITSMHKQGWQNGDTKGVVVGPAPSRSLGYYGTFNGNSQNNPPKVRITYKK